MFTNMLETNENRVLSGAYFECDYSAHNDDQLMLLAQEDSEVFGTLYQMYYPAIFGYCRRRTNSIAEAEDLSSQIFTRAFAGLHAYQGGMVAAWLFRIARNEVVNYYRKNRRPTVSMDDWELADEQQDFVDEIERGDNRRLLDKLLTQLPQEHRKLLLLSLEHGLSSYEIGHLLNTNPITVRTRLHRITKELRARYHLLANVPTCVVSD